MSLRTIFAGLAVLALSASAGAQERGTMELGAFASGAQFDHDLSLKTGFGGGGRIGMYLDRTWSVEFEDAEMRATRPNGLQDVNVGLLSGRLVNTPARLGRVQLLAGVGLGVSTETNFMHSYGVDALVGAKVPIGTRAAFRIDAVSDWLANEDWKSYRSIRVGMSFYRHPTVRTQPAPALSGSTPRPAAAATSTEASRTR